MIGPWNLPFGVLTDSYKLSHPFVFPNTKKMVCYGEFRQSFDKDPIDHRIVYYGIRYIIEHYVSRQWTLEDLDRCENFFSTHNAGFTPFPFPKDLFKKFILENNGYFPVKIQSLPEGSVIYPHVPFYQIIAEDEYSNLVTFLETMLLMIWYPSTVATLSRRARDLIEIAYETSVDLEGYFTLDSRLHDFGFRGCTSVEQSMIGGAAHLLNFSGTDTLSAAYYVQYELNEGKPVGTSIPATEHSVMTAYLHEKEAFTRMIDMYGHGVFACVMDSYDYAKALEEILPSIASHKLEKGGFLVLRPDSGDPVEAVLMALRAAEKVFGCMVNQKGYKVLCGCGVIQGDAITHLNMKTILDKVLEQGFSAQNVAFGMGGALLQKMNRDTLSCACKLSLVIYEDGGKREIMKFPKTDRSKFSLPGEFVVSRNLYGVPRVFDKASTNEENCLQLVYDHGKTFRWHTFDEIRQRVRDQWCKFPKKADVLSNSLKEKIHSIVNSR